MSFSDSVPIIPVRQVLFPGNIITASVGGSLVKMVRSVIVPALSKKGEKGKASNDTLVGIVARVPTKEGAGKKGADNIEPSDLYAVGTLARVLSYKSRNNRYEIVFEGVRRFQLDSFAQKEPFLKANVTVPVDSAELDDPALKALVPKMRDSGRKLLNALYPSPESSQRSLLEKTMTSLTSPSRVADWMGAVVEATPTEKQDILETMDVSERFKKLSEIVARNIQAHEISKEIDSSVAGKISKSQREFLLRQQLKAINEKLGESDEADNDGDALEKKLLDCLPEGEVLDEAKKELKRLKNIPPSSPEHSVISNYLNWLGDLPWTNMTEDILDIGLAQQVLDQDHCGLEKVKERILEYLSVRKLKNDMRGPIMCLVGPPGVGKTSLGKSVAQSMGREFYRMALGGLHDESEIRGHRRTYIGAMPGRIVQALKRVKTKNPVIMLDEIDKVSQDYRGDPSSALLEVLDPEQNHAFIDNYLGVPFDLSNVLFIATANDAGPIPGPLRDRMEMIQLPGYTLEEKLSIAKQHLIPKQMDENGLLPEELHMTDEVVRHITESYTREAGVRSLERTIGKVARNIAMKVAAKLDELRKEKYPDGVEPALPAQSTMRAPPPAVGNEAIAGEGGEEEHRADGSASEESNGVEGASKLDVNAEFRPLPATLLDTDQAVTDILGKEVFYNDTADRVKQPGIATGLAWTAAGGEILFIEASQSAGTGGMKTTGQLGDVMKESASAALSWIKSHAVELGLAATAEEILMADKEIHLHFPAGAVPKDGPSAGVTITTCLVSLLSGRKVRPDIAMTGEISLLGNVLPVGGIKEKLLAAHRAGIKQVFVPARNEQDLADLPEEIRNDLNVKLCSDVRDVLNFAFVDEVDGALRLPSHSQPGAVAKL